MSPSEAAERGLFERMGEDAVLAALIGSGTRLFATWPTDTMQASDFPRLTFYVFGPSPKRPGFQRVRVSLDIWVWPTGTTGGRLKLLAIDERLLELLDEVHFDAHDHRLYSIAGGFRDFPASPGGPIRRLREITIEASRLVAVGA